MKRLIAQEVARKDLAENIKLGPGRHPRDRVHRAGVSDRARRAEGPSCARARCSKVLPLLAGDRQLPATRSSRRSRRRIVTCAPSRTASKRWTTRRRTSCRTTPRSARGSHIALRRAELDDARTSACAPARNRRSGVPARRVGSRRGAGAREIDPRRRRPGRPATSRRFWPARRWPGDERVARPAQGPAPRRPLSAHGRGRPAAVGGRHGADAGRSWPSARPR